MSYKSNISLARTGNPAYTFLNHNHLEEKKCMRKPWRTLLLFIIIGIAGSALAVPVGLEMLQSMGITEDEMTPAMMVIVSILNPIILTSLAALTGVLLAYPSGFTSLIYVHDRFSTPIRKSWLPSLKVGAAAGIGTGIVLVIGDLLFRGSVPAEMGILTQEYGLYTFILSIVYGGIVEEILMRWGLMSLLVWLLWKVFGRSLEKPSSWIYWTSIGVSALAFAVGHYGATAAAVDITAAVLLRMILLNGIGGIVFGWLYWKKNLETAVFAHMFAHVAMHALGIIAG